MIERYLNTSEKLRAVFLLVDIRHAPSANDKQMFEWMAYVGYDPIVIATKLDKIKRSQIDKQIKIIRQARIKRLLSFHFLRRQNREEI